jgi:protein gp37
MPQGTAIEWTDATWNPVTGCTRVSPGCAHCYIERQTPMRVAHRKFARVGNASTTGVQLHPERLHWKRIPRGPRIFVCSMSDLFHEDVPDEFIAQVFEVMRWHTSRVFQVLTKRPERARDWFAWYEQRYQWNEAQHRRIYRRNALAVGGRFYEEHPDWLDQHVRERYPGTWPLPNVWVGVTIENARYASRADVLREIPAAVRFISAEPLLGSLAALDLAEINWLICGGESGPGYRLLHLDHARELRDTCVARGVAFFFKQHGGKTPKSGGKLLDGREWCELPLVEKAA